MYPTFQQGWQTVVSSMCNEAKTWATFGFTGNMGSIAGSSGDVAGGGGGGDEDIDKALVRCQDTNRFLICKTERNTLSPVYLKAVWPDLLGLMGEVWRGLGAMESFPKCGGPSALTFLKALQGTRSRQTPSMRPRESDQIAFRYRANHM